VWCTSDWTCPPFAARWTPACPNPRFGTECGWCACVAFSIDCLELSIVLQCRCRGHRVLFVCEGVGWETMVYGPLFVVVRGSCMVTSAPSFPSPSTNPLFTPIPFPIKSNPPLPQGPCSVSRVWAGARLWVPAPALALPAQPSPHALHGVLRADAGRGEGVPHPSPRVPCPRPRGLGAPNPRRLCCGVEGPAKGWPCQRSVLRKQMRCPGN
jgi:hypothetical protein